MKLKIRIFLTCIFAVMVILLTITKLYLDIKTEQKEEPKAWTVIAKEVIKSVAMLHGRNEYNQEVQGTGFVISSNGYIITNNHVLHSMTFSVIDPIIQVKFSDNTMFLVENYYGNKSYDLAILKVNTNNLSPLIFEEQRNPQIGEDVMVFGSTASLYPFAVKSIVARTELLSGMQIYNSTNLKGKFIHFSMTANPGFSGGPIVNKFGRVISICQGSSSLFHDITVGISNKDTIKALSILLSKITKIDNKTNRKIIQEV